MPPRDQMDHDSLRETVSLLLDGGRAHARARDVLAGFPKQRGERPSGFAHSAWQLLEHLRIAQDDILDFCVNAAYEHTRQWPDDYWPRDPEPPAGHAWTDSIASFGRSREALKRIARDEENLTAAVPTGTGSQTYLRAILLAADHAAYHVGQLVAVRRALGIWPAAR